MKRLLIIFLVIVSVNTFGQIIPKENDPELHPLLVNKTTTDSINHKRIDYYLNNESIDSYSKLFFKGKFALYDNTQTFAIIDSVLTDNPETRPFYFYVFNRILDLSDGALSEVVAGYCLDYFEKYPCEFFNNYKSRKYKIAISTWTTFIGWQLYFKPEFEIFEMKMDKKIENSCKQIKTDWKNLKIEIEKNLEE